MNVYQNLQVSVAIYIRNVDKVISLSRVHILVCKLFNLQNAHQG